MITNYLCNVTTNSYLLLAYLTVLLNLLTYWRKFHFLFITLYVLPKSCSFMHLTNTGLDLGLGLTVLWSH